MERDCTVVGENREESARPEQTRRKKRIKHLSAITDMEKRLPSACARIIIYENI